MNLTFEKPKANKFIPETYKKYLATIILMPCENIFIKEKVMAQAKDGNNNPIGVANRNPIHDTRDYENQF